jgi:hypothetical protein
MLEFENLISIGQVNFLQGFECLENIESDSYGVRSFGYDAIDH